MARRYGGTHSPGAVASAGIGPAVHPVGARANLMFVPPVLLALSSLGGGPVVLVAGLLGAATWTLGTWLLRDGLRAEAAYAARKVARRPALPRKILAAALAGLGTALAASTGVAGLLGAGLYGVAAAGLHIAAFGIDPLRDKRIEGVDSFQQDRVARVVDDAEAYLEDMAAEIGRLRDRALTARVAAFQSTARGMIRTVQEDPRDLTGARKFLGVYLMGARDATAKYADLAERRAAPEARADYVELLDDLERNFADRTQKLLADDRNAMDIEMKVLRDRLARDR
ncbi:hypothetical protein EU805_11785 [Salipiger sp. IMCC34102]|uniref:5-bromo-4-chloroindolyl phosphate hydrolysis family protein n=1 Tax=Salipiger sp. IMCC34102 TaxID=2510647 RepID=UPI00101D85C4|nr:5-bromo-4-chloroindolyl phosphate hydrolysis family protein [Salipiger sp. IMCC34102]RYH01864.1 hypothetical protein EU805_11785 [Salipiger sp. IMCC34102]